MAQGALQYDVCIVGGGVNGTGIARDLAARGARVLLCEKGDLASATSSSSTKLIHGGLRYLEYYDFKLVRSALKERRLLMKLAPHIIWPLRFILPHYKALRPRWLIRMGLFIYDHLARRDKLLPASRTVSLRKGVLGAPLLKKFKKGFSYSDCWVDDARLVALNAVSAAHMGAEIANYTSCTRVQRKGGRWLITLKDHTEDTEYCITASMIVNATGPWVKQFQDVMGLTQDETKPVRLVKGSHIIVKKMYEGDHNYILQQPDGRIIFTIPYEDDFTLIGTTEEHLEGSIDAAHISPNEIDYLCASINATFEKKIGPDDILYTYSGVRPLAEDGEKDDKAVSRDYELIWSHEDQAPMLSVYGGKITTYRKLSEKVANLIRRKMPRFELGDGQTHKEPLPGGDFSYKDRDGFVKDLMERYPFLYEKLAHRYMRSYGTLCQIFLEGKHGLDDLGAHFGAGLYAAEIDYLMTHEFALTPEDVLMRRTKLGLKLSDKEKANVAQYVRAFQF